MASTHAPAWLRAAALQHVQSPHVVRKVLAVLNMLPRRRLRRSFAGGAVHSGPQRRSQVRPPEVQHVDQDRPLLRDCWKQSSMGCCALYDVGVALGRHA